MSATDELLENNARYAEGFEAPSGDARPSRSVAIVACMDARIHVSRVLGLSEGDAHIIRNAGGVVTDDVIRSLAISQRVLGTTEVIVIQHTGCGMLGLDENEFLEEIGRETGLRPPWSPQSFSDLAEEVRQNVARLTASPYLPNRDSVRGFVYDVDSGRLREVL